MRDEDKTREELLTELQRTRIQMAHMMEAEIFRERAERELDMVAQIAASIVRNSPCGLLVLQRQSPDRLILVNGNPPVTNLLEAAIDEVSGAELEDIWPGATDQGVKQALLNALDTGEAFETDHASFRRHSAEKMLRLRAFPMPEERVGVYIAHVSELHTHPQAPDMAAENSVELEQPILDDGSRMVERLRQELEEDEKGETRVCEDEEPDREAEDLSVQLSEAHERIAEEIGLRQAAEAMNATIWSELENRVKERTEELVSVNQSLERCIAESQTQEEALRAVRYDLEKRLRNQENEIGELTEALEIEIEEHKKTEERLVAARIELETRMTEVDEELEFTNERLSEQIVERQRVEDELRASLSEGEGLVYELTVRLAETTESLDREIARREQFEESISRGGPSSVTWENSQLGIVTFDRQGTITALNSHLVAIFGTPSTKDLLGINLLDFPLVEDSGVSEAIQECLRSGEPSIQDYPFADASGRRLCVRIHVAATRGPSGEIIGGEAIFEDLSADRVREGRVARSERFDALSRMAGGLAAKFSETLQTFSAQVQEALACLESADFSHIPPLLERMLNQCRDAGRTARRLRQFSRMRPRREAAQPRVFDLTDVVKESIEMDALWSRPSTSGNGSDVCVEPSLTPGCRVEGEEDDFIEVMASLLENAVEAVSGGGKISVETFLDGDEVVTRVHNEGAGIPRNHKASLFEPFWTTKEHHDGLGLPVVFAIIRRYGGTMTVHSEEGKGATFTLRLPHIRELPAEQGLAGEEPARGNYRILLIYSLEPVARMIRKKLSRLGHSIFIAQTPEQGVDLLKRTKVDAIVCDLSEETAAWPDVNAAVTLMRMDTGCPPPPIILLTESRDQVAQSSSLTYPGLNRIVEKPVSVARLVEIVAEEATHSASGYPEMDWEQSVGCSSPEWMTRAPHRKMRPRWKYGKYVSEIQSSGQRDEWFSRHPYPFNVLRSLS